ncbi:unnamed protein product [Rotaria magnacalcarata]|uniref:G-protein coupled receptors family 1 profile domain-containing protein n=1 Tax=Rotaria magnacalcarata TaxID=392030 RepID=A0A814K8J7_9BILA|nr:unnamed protein product [Rotaria magnacalcarata]CAF1367859.1 unnamed protein product [Rotaria magnacalcarata]CAF2056198.1 unnamed protein product [Rotaria magnacalcarata]
MENALAGLVLNFLTLIADGCVCLISILIFIYIIIHVIFNRTKPEDKVTLILCANILILIFLYGAIVVSFSINSILGEFYGLNSDSSWCIFNGYLIAVIISAVYNVFISQATFRLCRIVYAAHKWLQLYGLYMMIGPIQLIIGFALQSPVLFWRDVKYISTENYCFVPYLQLHGTIWIISLSYGVPLLALLSIYIRITIFLYRRSTVQTLIVQRRQQRDLLVFKRIGITVSMLIIFGLPNLIFLLLTSMTGVEYALTYRIQWLIGSLSMLGLSITNVAGTPQLKSIVLNRWQRNRVGILTTTTSPQRVVATEQQTIQRLQPRY